MFATIGSEATCEFETPACSHYSYMPAPTLTQEGESTGYTVSLLANKQPSTRLIDCLFVGNSHG